MRKDRGKFYLTVRFHNHGKLPGALERTQPARPFEASWNIQPWVFAGDARRSRPLVRTRLSRTLKTCGQLAALAWLFLLSECEPGKTCPVTWRQRRGRERSEGGVAFASIRCRYGPPHMLLALGSWLLALGSSRHRCGPSLVLGAFVARNDRRATLPLTTDHFDPLGRCSLVRNRTGRWRPFRSLIFWQGPRVQNPVGGVIKI